MVFQNKGMEHSEDTTDYETVIVYGFTQYYMKRGLKELGAKGDTDETEDLYQIHMGDNFCPKSAENLNKEQNRDVI